jgi:hypothetical protein
MHTAARSRARRAFTLAACAAGLVASAHGRARAAPDKADWRHTGDGVMTASILVADVDVLRVGHDMRCLPERKSKPAVIHALCDKRFVWQALRDIDKASIHDSLRQGYRQVGYDDAAKIERALSAFSTGLDEGAVVTITWDAPTKTTAFLNRRAGVRVSVPGEDFMVATWSVLFANPDLRELGDALIAKL